MSDADAKHWWGEFELAEDECRWWTLGPLRLGVERKRREWRIGYEESVNGAAVTSESDRTVDALQSSRRFVFSEPGARIRLAPALADRPVVTRPLSPLFLPPGEQAVLFVSSPAWVRLEAVAPQRLLADMPVTRPSDTWFGPSTREGELCYATRTHGRLLLEDLPVQPYRVITPLEIANDSKSDLMVERVSLPVPNLTVYSSKNGELWTQKMNIRCDEDRRLVSLSLRNKAPGQVDGAVQVAPPRKEQGSRVLKRALTSLFG